MSDYDIKVPPINKICRSMQKRNKSPSTISANSRIDIIYCASLRLHFAISFDLETIWLGCCFLLRMQQCCYARFTFMYFWWAQDFIYAVACRLKMFMRNCFSITMVRSVTVTKLENAPRYFQMRNYAADCCYLLNFDCECEQWYSIKVKLLVVFYD